MALTPTEQANLVKTYAIAKVGTGLTERSCKVWGSIGLLKFLGLDPVDVADLKTNGKDRSVTRKAHKRSRWLGDRTGSTIPSNSAEVFLYPSRRGNALPGTPVQIVNLDERTKSGAHRKYTVQLDGKIANFIEWWVSKTHTYNSRIIGKTGNPYTGIVAKAGAVTP
jgi:hypothetical protein